MDDNRNLGKLHFINAAEDNEVNVYWEMLSGELGEKIWKVNVSFSKDFSVSDRVLRLLTMALENSAIQIVLGLQDGRKYASVIHNILEQADSGEIEIASPNLGRAQLFYN